MANNDYAVVLCGGSGTRLWPVSRSSKPKQLIDFDGEFSLLQNTIIRLTKKIEIDHIYLVTHQDHRFIVEDQISNLYKHKKPKIILEPVGRDTLPAIVLCVKEILLLNNNANISVFPSDHAIKNEEEFFSIWNTAIQSVDSDYLTLIGIKPDYPAEGYGYIKPSNESIFKNDKNIVYKVEQFKEKPDCDTAKEFIMNGYLWNAGMFIFNIKTFISLMKKFQLNLLKSIMQAKEEDIKKVYSSIESISIDYGLVEHADNVAVISGSLEWSDLGNWRSIYTHLKSKNDVNFSRGDVVLDNTTNSLVWNERGLVATSGVDNLIIVNTSDATLVCNKDTPEKVKELVSLLRKKKPNLVETHLKVFRPWGSYTVLEQGKGFKIKRIEVKPKQKLSLQLHKHRSEHWVVVDGVAKVINGDTEFTIKKNESTFIPPKTKHCLENPSNKLLIIIEVQSGDYLEEDDILRFGDNYGRHN